MSATTAVAPVRATSRTGRARRWVIGAAFVLVAALAYAVRLRLITHGAGLTASDGYDDGVYYAAADALIHGRIPYRDFLLLHPPGSAIALAPFAALGALLGDPVGVAAGRLAFIGIGSVAVAMLGLIALRHSRGAAVVAGVSAAVFFPLAYTERSTLLEPFGTALLLAAVLVLQHRSARRGVLIAGVLAGCAIDMRIWYALPVLLLGLLAAPRRRLFLAGAAVSASAIALPFFVSAPVAMFREVVLDQAGRTSYATIGSIMHRLVAIGSAPVHGASSASRHEAYALAALVLIAVVVAAIGAWRVRWSRVYSVITVATAAVLLVSPSFFVHYVDFVAPWMLLVLAIGSAELARRIRLRPIRIVAVLLPLALVVAVNVPTDLRSKVKPQPVAVLEAAMRGRTGCVVSDDPGLLANAGLLTPQLRRGCAFWPDVTGWTYDKDASAAGTTIGAREGDPMWQKDLMAYLTSGDYVVLNRAATGLSPANRAELAESPVIARAGGMVVYDLHG